MRVSSVLRRLRRALVLAYNENCFSIAKGAAYSALLALFPVLTTLATVLVRVQAESVSAELSKILARVVPPGTEGLVLYGFAERGDRPAFLLVLAGVVTVWGASGVMLSLMEGFNRIYQVSGRPFLRQRLMAAWLVVTSTLPLVAASAMILFGSRTERALVRWIGVMPMGDQMSLGVLLAGKLARYGIAVLSIMLVCALLFHLGPNRRMRWRAAWPGAILATALWLPTTYLFGGYVRNIADYNVLYGSLGAVIALLVWMYVLAVIALFGCAFNAEWEKSQTRRRKSGEAAPSV